MSEINDLLGDNDTVDYLATHYLVVWIMRD